MVGSRTARCPDLLWFIELQLLQTSASEIPQCKLLIVNRNVTQHLGKAIFNRLMAGERGCSLRWKKRSYFLNHVNLN